MFKHVDFKFFKLVGYILFIALPLVFFVLSWQETQIDFRNKASQIEETEGEADMNCIPNCIDKECGNDGCNGSCGECLDSSFCNDQGICEINPKEDIDSEGKLQQDSSDAESTSESGDTALNIADMNKDNKVNIEDLKLFLYYHNTGNRKADLNKDNIALQDQEDLEIFTSFYQEVQDN